MAAHDARATIKLTPENEKLVDSRIQQYKSAGLEVSRVAVANELISIGGKIVEPPTPIKNGR